MAERRSYNFKLTRETVNKRVDQHGEFYDSVIDPKFTRWKPRKGINNIRFFPPTWENPQHWGYDVWLHYGVGADEAAYLCAQKMLGKPCAVCEERRQLANARNADAAKALGVKKAIAAWMVDRSEEDEGPQVWLYGYTVDEDISGRLTNRRTGAVIDILDIDEGFDISFRRDGEGRQTKYTGIEIDRQPTYLCEDQKIQDKWLDFVEANPIPSVLQFYDYDYIKSILYGLAPVREEGAAVDTGRGRRERPPSRSIDPAPASETGEPVGEAAPGRSRRPGRYDETQRGSDGAEPPPRRQRSTLARDLDDEIPSDGRRNSAPENTAAEPDTVTRARQSLNGLRERQRLAEQEPESEPAPRRRREGLAPR